MCTLCDNGWTLKAHSKINFLRYGVILVASTQLQASVMGSKVTFIHLCYTINHFFERRCHIDALTSWHDNLSVSYICHIWLLIIINNICFSLHFRKLCHIWPSRTIIKPLTLSTFGNHLFCFGQPPCMIFICAPNL